MSGLTSYGFVTIGQCVPMALTASASLSASIGLALPELTGKLAGFLNVQAALSIGLPSLSANIDAIAKVALSLSLAIEGPTVTLQLSAIAGLIAELQFSLGQLHAQLSFSLGFAVALGTAGIAAYGYDGPVSGLGSAVSAATSSGLPGGNPTDQAHAVILLATDPAAASALASFFLG